MEYIGSELLPIREKNDMCPNIAINTLNRKGYQIPYVSENYPLPELVRTINSFVADKGLVLKKYTGASISIGVILQKKGDGVLVLDNVITRTSHVIAFINDGSVVTFYDGNSAKLRKYKLKEEATITTFTADFIKLFPNYAISEVYVIEPNSAGKRRKTRKRTRKNRR